MQYATSNSPVRIQQASAKAGTIQNLGPSVVYVGKDSSTGSLDFPIPVGASAPVSAGEVWAYSPDGLSVISTSATVGVPSTVVPNYGVNKLLTANVDSDYVSNSISVFNYLNVGISIKGARCSSPINYGSGLTTNWLLTVNNVDLNGTLWSAKTYQVDAFGDFELSFSVASPAITITLQSGTAGDDYGNSLPITVAPVMQVTGYSISIPPGATQSYPDRSYYLPHAYPYNTVTADHSLWTYSDTNQFNSANSQATFTTDASGIANNSTTPIPIVVPLNCTLQVSRNINISYLGFSEYPAKAGFLGVGTRAAPNLNIPGSITALSAPPPSGAAVSYNTPFTAVAPIYAGLLLPANKTILASGSLGSSASPVRYTD